MLALRLLAIISLFALSTIPFAVASSDDDEHRMSEGVEEGLESAEGLEGENPEGEEGPVD